MKFSDRSNWPAAQNEIATLKAALERDGKPILDLTVSNPAQCEFQYLKPELLKPLADAANLRYEPDPHGLLKAREAVSQYYARKGVSVSPERIFLTAGTSEAYSFIFRLIANPQDAILAPRPGYPLFDYLAGLNDLKVKHYPLVYQNGWRIESLPDTAARALILVNPNNPTGNFIHPGEWDLINRFAHSCGAAVISDEVFFDFAFERRITDTKSFAQNREALTFTLGGVSKAIGLPQMKLGWMAVTGSDDLVREAAHRLEIICDTYLSAATPAQRALPFWLEHAAGIQREILGRLEKNRAFLKQKLSGISGATLPSATTASLPSATTASLPSATTASLPSTTTAQRVGLPSATTASLLEAEGGWYAVVEIKGEKSDDEWALLFLKESRVFVHPGYLFDFPEGNFLVLSLLLPPAIFEEAVDRMVKRLRLNSNSGKFHKSHATC